MNLLDSHDYRLDDDDTSIAVAEQERIGDGFGRIGRLRGVHRSGRLRQWTNRSGTPEMAKEHHDTVSEILLTKVAAGDMTAMQECIERYSGLVYGLARRLCPVASDVDDAAQEVFISLWENASRYDEAMGSEVTFVAMITRRRLIDRGRKYKRERRLIDEVKVREESAPVDTRDTVETADASAAAAQALEGLSTDQQRVLKLAIHYGLTHEQIARHTELPLGTVKTHARRGLQRVREMLREKDAPSQVEVDS
ncbi:MAG: sigma-70 family RNA polymerase sigma factor [Planctomycetota bacterium]